MKYRIIALDLDGTALTAEHKVQQSTTDAVRWAREQGVYVMLSTGRIVGEAAEFALQMGADDWMVTGGGSSIGSAATGECIERCSFPWEVAAQVAEMVEQADMNAMIYCGEQLFLTEQSDIAFSSYKKNEGFLNNKVVLKSVAEHIRQNQLAIDKLFTRCADAARLQSVRAQLEKLPQVRVLSSAADNLEVIAPNTDKATALARVAERLGTDLEHTIAIGDSENDLEMLQAVGMPIAMGNATDEVKRLAKYITQDNHHDGVAQAIYYALHTNGDVGSA